MGRFQDLKVWQRAKDLAVYIYRSTGEGAFFKNYGLRDQMRRAAVSIPSNIAEGDELGSEKQAVRYFYIGKGSSAELLTQAILASEVGYLSREVFCPYRIRVPGRFGYVNTTHPSPLQAVW